MIILAYILAFIFSIYAISTNDLYYLILALIATAVAIIGEKD
jgi:hypothetical protein